jgi:hypothetical protein
MHPVHNRSPAPSCGRCWWLLCHQWTPVCANTSAESNSWASVLPIGHGPARQLLLLVTRCSGLNCYTIFSLKLLHRTASKVTTATRRSLLQDLPALQSCGNNHNLEALTTSALHQDDLLTTSTHHQPHHHRQLRTRPGQLHPLSAGRCVTHTGLCCFQCCFWHSTLQ